MGIGLQRFIGGIDDNLVCGICSGVFEDAVLTACGHAYCFLCLKTWLNRSGGTRSRNGERERESGIK